MAGLDESSEEVLIEGISQQMSNHNQQHHFMKFLQEENKRLKLINEDHER